MVCRNLFFLCALGLLLGSPLLAEDTRERLDVILLTIDTLRADALGFAGQSAVATPLLDRLAATGRVFPNAHGHNVVTLPSHTNILTGLYPHQHGVRDNQGFRLNAEIPTLATVLSDAGFRTAAFVAAYPLDSTFGLDRGFSLYDDRNPKGTRTTEFLLPERRGDAMVELALSWWRGAAGGPRFLWLHLFDPHAPYDPPEPFASRYREHPYLGEVAAVDHFLTPLLAPLLDGEERPALVVFTSDHGEGLGDHGERTHGLFAYEATLRVPLVIWGPGVESGRDLRWARHVDLLPTVLDAVGVALPTGRALPGHSLLQPAVPSTTYFEALSAHLHRGWAPLHGLLRGGKKLIALPLPELYDLEKDPREITNLVRKERRLAGELRDALPAVALDPPAPTVEDSSVAARLQSLGYLAGGAAPKASYGPEDDPKNLVDLDRKMHRIIELYSRGDFRSAVTLAREIVAARPAMALGRSLLAQALLENGQREEALDAMRDALAQGATTAALRRQLGLTLAEAGQHREALAVLEPAASGDDVEALGAYGLALSEAGQQDRAETVLRRLLTLDPEHPVAHQRLALVELRRQRWPAARDAAQRALALDDSMARAWNVLGVALFQLGEPSDACDAWQRAVDLDSQLFDALYNLGTRALEGGREEQALAALRRFVETAPPERYAADLRRARVLLARLERKRSTGP